MALASRYQVVISDSDRRVLTGRARAERTAHRDVLRARIVLAAADGQANAAIARRLGLCADTVRKWRARFCAEGLAGLADRHRPGRRRTFPATAEAEVKALACALPAETGAPLARWSAAELAAEGSRSGGGDFAVHGRPLAGRRRDPSLAASIVDLSPRSGLRRQGRPSARPLRPDLGRPTAEQRRVRALR
jgi:transposase